ncbi:hypothetical protein JI749_11045 [Devosia oryziradicis]|uniref:Transposase DDE domain-containing protein n=1 Tax=Devosia oryziradicis TaxID=2801335 RepID=A0ABX7BV47_9HYPH|nr:hypothetical protein [Devosia oryziradicis]QQR34914.1 hypothetical protein JI749_11045 [Devosia oryziradicis]
MPKAITALAKLVQPLSVVVQFFTADDGYQINSRPRRAQRGRRSLNG